MMRVPPNDAGIAAAVAALQRDEIVAHPTETVYGLAVNPFSAPAMERLFAAKGRDRGNPVLLIVADFDQLSQAARQLPDVIRVYTDRFWPGPLSLLLPKSDALHDTVTAGSAKVCVRCPACPIARRLCRAWGGPLTSTSANLSGEAPALQPEAIVLPGVTVILDGGVLAPSAPSTVFDPETGRIFREGAVSRTALEALRPLP